MIELKNISIRTKTRVIADNLNWSLEDPGIYLILGPTASGKTVLSEVMSGHLAPNSGKVLIDGDNLYSIIGQYTEPVFLAKAEQHIDDPEPLDLYLKAELANAAVSFKLMEPMMSVLERLIPDALNQPISKLSHGQMLIAQAALAICLPVRLAVLDGHLTYFDQVFIEALNEMIADSIQLEDKYLVFTASRLAYSFPKADKRFLLSNDLPIAIEEIPDGQLVDQRVKPIPNENAVVVRFSQHSSIQMEISSGKHYRLLSRLEDGIRIEVSGNIGDALNELTEQNLEIARVEWERA